MNEYVGKHRADYCYYSNNHATQWIENPIFGSCGEGRLVVVGCCSGCPISGKLVKDH